MKKIIVALFAFVLNINNVFALEEWQEEKLEGDNVVTEYRYKFYTLEKHGEYLNYRDEKYEYVDYSDVSYGEFGDWMDYCSNSEYIDIEYGTKYYYKEILPVKYIKILNTGSGDIVINNIAVYDGDNLLKYYVDMNDNYDTNNNIIHSNGYLIIKVGGKVSLKNLTLFLDTSDGSKFDLFFCNNNIILMDRLVAITSGNNLIKRYIYNKNDYDLYYNYTNELTSYNIDIDEFIKIESTDLACRSREKRIFNYNLEKVYYDDNYYKDISDLPDNELKYIKDLDSYKIYYKYIELEENNDSIEEISDSLTNEENEIPVKTGIDKKISYCFYAIFVFVFFIILLQNKSIKKCFKN